MLHYIFALFIILLTQPTTTEFTQPKIPQSKSSQNCSAILNSISKESKDKKEKIKQDLDKITVFIPTKEFYKKKLLDPAQTNDQSISIPQFLKKKEKDDDEDDDDEKEIDQIIKNLQNILPANNSPLEMNNNAVTVNPNYGIGIVPEEEQQNKKKTQLDVNLNLALHLDFDKNLELIYSKHKDFCKDKEIISDKNTSTDNSSFLNANTLLSICAAAGITCLIIKTAPVTVPIAVAIAATRKNSKRNYAFCAPCDNFTTNQDHNLPIIWILQEESQSNLTKENIIAGLTQEGSIKMPTGATAIGVAGVVAGAGLGLNIGLGSGAGTVAATAGGVVITGTIIPVIIGGAVVGYTIKLSIDAVRELIQHVKHIRAEKKAKKILEKNNAGGSNNSGNNGNNNNDKDPKHKKDKTPKPFVKKHPERTYEPNGNKHHPNAKNGIGKPSKNPVENLDKAIKIPGKDSLVTIEDDYFVMFQEHSPGKYHDYIVEKFNDLPREAKNALYDAGLVRDITKGKIKK